MGCISDGIVQVFPAPCAGRDGMGMRMFVRNAMSGKIGSGTGGDRGFNFGYITLRFGLKERSAMAEHKHGAMDISVQEKTYAGFIKATIRVVAVTIFVLLFLAVFNS